MNNRKTYSIAITGIFIGIVGLITLVPGLGLIPLNPVVTINIVLIPIVIASQTTNLKSAIIVSTVFGVFSMINSYIRPTSLLSFAVQNPLVSILPRFFIGIMVWYSYGFFKKIIKQKVLASSLSAAVGVLTNTTLFFAMLLIVYSGAKLNNGGVVNLALLGTILGTNFVFEMIITVLAVPAIVSAIEKTTRKSV